MEPVVSENATITEKASLTYNLKRISTTDTIKFRLNFSDGPIITVQPYSFASMTSWLIIEIEGYTSPVDFTYELTYQESIQTVDIEIEVNNSIASSTIKAIIRDKNKFKTTTGKTLENKEATTDFAGYSKISNGLSQSLETFSSMSGEVGATVVTSGVGALTMSSLLGNSLGFLTKMIQIIEFTALME